MGERHDLGDAGRPAGRQERGERVGAGRFGVRGQGGGSKRLAVEGDAPVHRQDDDPFDARRRGADALELFIEPARRAGGGANTTFALTAASCAAIASRLNRRLSGCTTAELIAAQ